MPSPAAALLGEDGRGYELARRLDGCGAWRAWLGEASYATIAHALASPASWDAFLEPSPASSSSNRAHLHLQLRVRALLFDRAAAAALNTNPSSSFSLAEINPNYLELHGDDIYFSFEDDQQDVLQHQKEYKSVFSPAKVNEHSYERSSGVGSKYQDVENGSTSQRNKHEECPDAWYSQFIRKHRLKNCFFPHDKEHLKRTSDGMSMYLRISNIHKRKRRAFKEEQILGVDHPILENGSSCNSESPSDIINIADKEYIFFPEIMFPGNCVPDSALTLKDVTDKKLKVEVSGVLDNLPALISKNASMIERFGIIPEYHKMGNKYRGKNCSTGGRESLCQEEASKMTHKVVARALEGVSFESASESSMKVLSEILGGHILKLGRMLKLLSDSYKKQYSSIELIRMFLQTAGHSNFGALADITREGNKSFAQQTQQHFRPMHPQHQSSLLHAQNIQRQQMQQMTSQSMLFQQQQLQQSQLQQQQLQQPQLQQQQQQLQQQLQQQQHQLQQHQQQHQLQQHQQQLQQQQWDKLRRRQVSTSRGPVIMDREQQPMLEVKLENAMDSSMDGTFGTLNKQQQLQLRQQMAMASNHPQSAQQFKQMSTFQLSQLQAQNVYNMRTPQVKVESFNELMNGDATINRDSDQNKLTSSR